MILPALAVGLALTMAAPAQARVTPSSSSATSLYFSASLSGANEIGAPGAPKGSAKSRVQITGDRVTFAFTWKGITAPTKGHLHLGGAGENGDVKIPLFTSALPATTTGAAGVVTVTDADLVEAITRRPADFYLNLHTAEFPAGAVRGQLRPARRERAPLDLLKGLPLQTLMDGGQEAPAAGDSDGQGIAMVRASGRRITYTLAWVGISKPVMSHLHVGAAGASGPVVVPLFTSAVPSHIYAVSGQVRDVSKSLVTTIRHAPRGYYVNVHTAEFPAGAIRGQLFPAGHIGS